MSSVRIHWKEIGTVCLIAGILGILWYIGILKYEGFEGFEGFVTSPPEVTVSQLTGKFEAEEAVAKGEGGLGDYFQKQMNFFHNQTAPPLFHVTPSLVNTAGGVVAFGEKVNAAMAKARILQDLSPDLDYSAHVRVNSEIDPNAVAFQGCQALKTVEDWASSNSVTQCGWLFVPDNDTGPKLSASVNGTVAGPNSKIKYNKLPITLSDTGLKWFWTGQKTQAKQAEYEKQCKRIKGCGLLDPAVPCAFNTRIGEGLYYDRSVTQPENPDLITHPGNCPKNYQFCTDSTTPANRQICIRTVLKYEGIPEKSLLYGIIGKDISGTPYSNIINTIYERAKTPTSMKLTETDTKASESGWMWDQWTEFRKKVQYLKQVAVSYDTFLADLAQMIVYGELVDGRIFILANYYTEAAINAVRTGSDAYSQLANGILQMEWRKAGCQASGAEYPSPDAQIPLGKSLADLQREYTTLHSQAISSESQQLQAEAVKKCINRTASLGTKEERSDFCNERGIEYFLYDGEGEQAILIGHEYSIAGLVVYGAKVKIAERMKNLLESASIFPTISYKVRTMLSTNTTITMTPHPVWQNPSKYKVFLNKVSLSFPYTTTFPTGRRNIFEMEYKGERQESWGSPRYSFIDLNLDMFQLFQSSTKPFVSFNFYEGTLLDANRLVGLVDSAGIQFTPGSGTDKGIRRGSASTDVLLTPRIRSKLIEIISQRVKVLPSINCTLFRLEDESAYSEMCQIENRKLVYTIRRGYDNPIIFRLGDISGSGWMNVAIAFTRSVPNQITVTAYINQIGVGTAVTNNILNETFTRPLRVICMPRDFPQEMELAWFHIYDQKLTGERVEGFQGSQGSQTTPPILNILNQEATFDPQRTDVGTLNRIAANIGGFMSRQIDQTLLRSYTIAASPTTTVSSALPPAPSLTGKRAVCEFDEVSLGTSVSANYTLGTYYEQKFDDTKLSGTTIEGTILSAKECEDKCTTGCIAYTFNSAKKTCKTYSDLGATLTTIGDPNSFSAIITPKENASYSQLKQNTLDAITKFESIRNYFKKNTTLYDRAFRPRAEFGSISANANTSTSGPSASPSAVTPSINKLDDPRTDIEIEKDKKAVTEDKYRFNEECLKAIFEKYRV